MKKFTIIASPKYEHLFLEELSKARAVQLKDVTGIEFERLKAGERTADYEALYEKYHAVYQSVLEMGLPVRGTTDLSTVELDQLFDDPKGTVENFLTTLEEFKEKLAEAKTEQDLMKEDNEKKLLEARLRLESVRALEPDELRRCLAVGVVKLNLLDQLVEHLQRFDDI
ncbi:MAG TPA: hypothetical protein VM050_13120, partial [Patescibacteria group bacterium]|nr:hypothetical protein [Patescibacteria group bacterium]